MNILKAFYTKCITPPLKNVLLIILYVFAGCIFLIIGGGITFGVYRWHKLEKRRQKIKDIYYDAMNKMSAEERHRRYLEWWNDES
jgi:hypothetical protein